MGTSGAPGATAGRTLLLHASLLALLLALPLRFVADDGAFSADEGAVLAQLDVLDRGSWTLPAPQPTLDPEGEALPLDLPFVGVDGEWAPFHKHVPYVLALRAAEQVAGDVGPWLVGWLGTIGAALGCALLAERVRPGSGRLALWACGLATPLLFDGYLLIAHSLGAALAASAVVLLLRTTEAPSAARALVPAAGAALLVALLATVRTEGTLLGLAAAAAIGATVVVPSWRGRARLPAVVASAAAGGGAVAGRLLDPVLNAAAWGDPRVGGAPAVDAGGSFVGDRLDAFATTWLWPSYDLGTVAIVGVVGLALLAVGALAVRREAEPGPIARAVAVAAVAAYAVRLTEWRDPVPGLLVAFPWLVGLLGVDRPLLRRPAARTLALTAALFALAVLATQYSSGGYAEWGGRYFALGLPLAVPLVLAGGSALLDRLDRASARVVLGAAAAITVVLAALALTSLDAVQERNTEVAQAVVDARAEVGGTGGAAPVLTTSGAIGRLAWPAPDDGVWLTTAPDLLARYAERLAGDGRDVLFFSTEPARDLPVVEAFFVAEPIAGEELWRLTPR